MRRSFIVCCIAAATVWACSEATDGLTPTLDGESTTTPATPDADDEPADGDSKSKPKDAGRVDAQTSSSSTILINEVSSDTCPDGDHVFCVHGEFGISKKNGENLYLLDKNDAVVGTVVYPADAAANTDESWSRIPDRDPKGTFQHAAPTPGAENQP